MPRRKQPTLPPLVDVPGRPAFAIINRYMPDASEVEKEEAYQNLQDLMAVLVGIDERLVRENQPRRTFRD